MKQIIVIGGGAAGLMAAVIAGREGARVILLEKMNMVGKKDGGLLVKVAVILQIMQIWPSSLKNTPGNGKFLYGAYERFSNEDLLELLHSWGLKTKVERGGRVFPESDSALEVTQYVHENP